MNSVEEAIEVAAQAWHERLWNGIVEDAQKTLELAESGELWRYYDDPAHMEEAVGDAKETVEYGIPSWEDSNKEYARKQVRQTVLDALPAFLYALADETIVFADGAWTKPDEKIHLGWTAGYLKETAEEIKD